MGNNQTETEAVIQRCSAENLFLEISQNSQENTCALFFNKVAPLNFEKFLKTPFSQNTSGRLLLNKSFR